MAIPAPWTRGVAYRQRRRHGILGRDLVLLDGPAAQLTVGFDSERAQGATDETQLGSWSDWLPGDPDLSSTFADISAGFRGKLIWTDSGI